MKSVPDLPRGKENIFFFQVITSLYAAFTALDISHSPSIFPHLSLLARIELQWSQNHCLTQFLDFMADR